MAMKMKMASGIERRGDEDRLGNEDKEIRNTHKK
jgi:hypothetical protein